MTPRALITVGLGYGDEGKGSIVDYLAREYEAKLVVRYNGGPQAAHNVVLSDGRHHEFHSLGAASFIPGVRTHLASRVMIEPYAIANEAEAFFNAPEPFYCLMRREAYDEFIGRGVPLRILHEREGMTATSGRVLWRTHMPLTRFVVVSRASGPRHGPPVPGAR